MNLLRRQLKEFEDKIKILKASENAKLKSINIMEIKHKEEENILKAKVSGTFFFENKQMHVKCSASYKEIDLSKTFVSTEICV